MMFTLDLQGDGHLTRLPVKTSKSTNSLPSVMFAPGRVLSLRENREAVVVDINTAIPTVQSTASASQVRLWGSASVLPDGKVWVSGGSGVTNEMTNVAYGTEIWDPATGQWTTAASTNQPRLYHSTSTLLPDGTVLLAGGGRPGPVLQMNGTIYYPPYLFERNGSGRLTTRPRIQTMPTVTLGWSESFTIKVTQRIARATLLRASSVTHSFDSGARFFELLVTQVDNTVTLVTPDNPFNTPSGFYWLFVWNPWGVPSEARMVRIA